MKKTIYFIILTILVAGILSITALSIYQNQISADENMYIEPEIYEDDLWASDVNVPSSYYESYTGGASDWEDTYEYNAFSDISDAQWAEWQQNATVNNSSIDQILAESNFDQMLNTLDEMTNMPVSLQSEIKSILDDAKKGIISESDAKAKINSLQKNLNSDNKSNSGLVSKILPSQPSNLSGVQDIGTIIQRAIQVLFYGAQIIFIIILLYGGIGYLTSMGEEAKMASSRKAIFAALIGIVIVFSVWAIAQFVINALQ